jgi:hypothetical protein
MATSLTASSHDDGAEGFSWEGCRQDGAEAWVVALALGAHRETEMGSSDTAERRKKRKHAVGGEQGSAPVTKEKRRAAEAAEEGGWAVEGVGEDAAHAEKKERRREKRRQRKAAAESTEREGHGKRTKRRTEEEEEEEEATAGAVAQPAQPPASSEHYVSIADRMNPTRRGFDAAFKAAWAELPKHEKQLLVRRLALGFGKLKPGLGLAQDRFLKCVQGS